MDGVWRKMVVSGSTLAIISHQSTFRGERGIFSGFPTRVSFMGGTGEFSHQSILSGGNGENFFSISFSRDQEEDLLSAWPLVIFPSMEDSMVFL